MKAKLPFIISVLTMLSGVIISIWFGINEDYFKNKIANALSENQKIAAIADPVAREAKIAKESEKNWRYYQRFHFHSTGIGAMSLASVLLLAFIMASAKIKLTSAYMISVGGFLYPFVWLFSGIYGPVIGRSEAKEAFAIFGYMGGVFLLGLAILLYLVVRYPISVLKEDCCK